MPEKSIENELLKYLYDKKKREKMFKVKLSDVFEEFNGEQKETLIDDLEKLSFEKLIYIQGEDIEEFKREIPDNHPIALVITRKGIDSIENNENRMHDSLNELFKQ
ncbi:hypothetical protein [Methanococcus sp. CF]